MSGSASMSNQPAASISSSCGTTSPPRPFGGVGHHQAVREGPALAAVVAQVAHRHAHFLGHLAVHAVFQRFAGLDEAGQRAEHARRVVRRSRQQQLAAARAHQHHHRRAQPRVGAVAAGRTLARSARAPAASVGVPQTPQKRCARSHSSTCAARLASAHQRGGKLHHRRAQRRARASRRAPGAACSAQQSMVVQCGPGSGVRACGQRARRGQRLAAAPRRRPRAAAACRRRRRSTRPAGVASASGRTPGSKIIASSVGLHGAECGRGVRLDRRFIGRVDAQRQHVLLQRQLVAEPQRVAQVVVARRQRVGVHQHVEIVAVEHQPGHEAREHLGGEGHLVHRRGVRAHRHVVPAAQLHDEALGDALAQRLGLGSRARRVVVHMRVVAQDVWLAA